MPSGCRKTHDQFVVECREKGLDLPVEADSNRYTKAKNELDFVCQEKHIYRHTADVHLHGHGCRFCYILSRTKTHEQYVTECREMGIDLPSTTEGNRYVNAETDLDHKCSEGHVYPLRPKHHLSGGQCPICYMSNKHEKYVTECRENGRDLPVDREDNKYVASGDHLDHACNVGHIYPRTPSNHSQALGCPVCIIEGRKKPHDQYVAECIEKGLDLPIDDEDNRYDGNNHKLDHMCSEGHIYPQIPRSHLDGHGCWTCDRIGRRRTHEEYVTECMENGYDLPVEAEAEDNRYGTNRTILNHLCSDGHIYPQAARHHLDGAGCRTCDNLSKRKPHAQYVTECEERDLDLPVEEYATGNNLLKHRCKRNHVYSQRPSSHLSGSGCTYCRYKTEAILFAFLLSLGFTVLREQTFAWTLDETGKYRRRRFDFYIPSLNLLIELDGGHHFGTIYYSSVDPEEQLHIDCDQKMVPALLHGLSMLRIVQTDLYKDRSGNVKEQIRLAIVGHLPTDLVVMTIANDPKMYAEHLKRTDDLFTAR